MRVRILALVSAVLVLFVAACGGGDDDTEPVSTAITEGPTGTVTAAPTVTPSAAPTLVNPRGNLIVNSGFEEGSEPWLSLDPESSFELSQEAAFTGANSAVLHMDDPAGATGDRVYYLVQEITANQFPDVLSGAYRVLDWEKGTPKQYLQVVVIVFGADNNPLPVDNFQIRYVLAGVAEEPLEIGNAKYRFFSTEEPLTGGWLTFETRVKNDFESEWGVIPEGFDKIRVLFEVRYDDRTETDGPSRADVWYDDLYLGSAN